MIFDSEVHKQIVAAIIDNAQFKGALADTIAELRLAVQQAKVEAPEKAD